MSWRVDTKQEILIATSPELTVAEAIEFKPNAEASVRLCQEELAKAAMRVNDAKRVCDSDIAISRFPSSSSVETIKQLAELDVTLRDELYSLREEFAFDEHIARRNRLRDKLSYVTSEYDHLTSKQMGANRLALSDAEVNLLEAEHSLLTAQFVLSRVSTIANLGPVVAEEGGTVGIIGPKTEMLREATNTKLLQLQAARQAAHEARRNYERQQAALASRGIITSVQR